MDPQSLLDKYALENIPGITNLDVDGSPLDHQLFLLSGDTFFSERIDRLEGVQGRNLLSYSTRIGDLQYSPLLKVVGDKPGPNYVNNIKKIIELLTDGSVSRENVERYLNHYVKYDNNMNPEIKYTPVLYFGRMNGEYIKFLGQYGFDPNLPIIFKDRTSGIFKIGLNSLGLIDEDHINHGFVNNYGDSSDSYEDIELTKGQRAASEALVLGADMYHSPQDVLEKYYDTGSIFQPRVSPVSQIYPHTFLSDKSYRHSLAPQPNRLWTELDKELDEQDRIEMEKRLPTTNLLQQLELLKPEQKLALAKFFEQTNMQGVDELFDTLQNISEKHDSMNPYVTRDSSGRRMNTRYLMDKQRGGKNTKKKQRGGKNTKKKQRGGRRSKKIGKRSKKRNR